MKKIKIGRFRTLNFEGNYSNCKFSTFDQVQSCLQTNEEKTIEAIKKETKHEVSWFVTLSKKKYLETLKKEFTPIYIQKVPIGYEGKYQYHCLFRGGVSTYNNRLDKEPDNSPLLTDKNLNKILNYKSKTWLKKFLIKFT